MLAGYAPPKHKYIRIGYLFDPDPEALVGTPFKVDISDPDYEEYWADEVQVFHNPRASRPIPLEAFPDAAHFFYKDGKLVTQDRPGRVLSSVTIVFQAVDDKRAKQTKEIGAPSA